jgi:hypothetical protein
VRPVSRTTFPKQLSHSRVVRRERPQLHVAQVCCVGSTEQASRVHSVERLDSVARQTKSNPARPLAAPPHYVPTHATHCTPPPGHIAPSPGGVEPPSTLWRGWIYVVNGLALTCKFPEWHCSDSPKTATAHTVLVVNRRIRYML